MSNARSGERDTGRTTVVGRRPPGSGKDLGAIPRGIEVLVSKASVDAEFRTLLLERRASAADEIGLDLSPAESRMLDAIPEAQLEAVINRTTVDPANRRAFLGTAAFAMLAALGAVGLTAGCTGSRPDHPLEKDEEAPKPTLPTTQGIRPDRLPAPTGSRPN